MTPHFPATIPGPRRAAALVAAGAALALLGAPLAPAPAAAQQQDPEQLRQQAEQLLGRPISDQEIMQMIQQSGLSPDQVRGRLQARGVEPSLADPYLEAIQGRREEPDEETDTMTRVQIMSALQGAGRGAAGDTTPGQFLGQQTPFGQQSPLAGSEVVKRIMEERLLLQRERERGPPIFGRELFLRSTTQFEPVKTGPVPDNYQVGPGDQIIVVLTGQVEQSYERTVGPEGWIVLPEVGRIFVAGRSMAELNEVMFRELSQAYSGLREDGDGATDFDVTLGELRTNQVFVIGEVERPAAYEVSALGTAMTALYRAGGPARSGSFRDVVVNRDDSTVARLDLYDYLVEGDASSDAQLRQGDIVFVPPARNRVRLSGPVKRPGLYEFREGETLRDVLRYAGGLEPDASLRRIQVERIAGEGGARPGQERRILDVSAERLAGSDEAGGFELRAGDRITLFAVLGDVRNQVSLSGGVWRPGTYSVTEDTRLWDVLQRAGGLVPDAVQARAQIQRLREESNTRRMIQVSLERDSAGEPVENPRLEGRDQVIVFARRNLMGRRAVSIGGWVRNPGVYSFVDGMTVADLVLKAGGLRTGAYTGSAEVARVTISQARTDTLTRRYTVGLDSSYVFGSASEAAAAGPDALGAEAANFELENLDAVYVRRAPGYEPQQRVVVTGEVQFPGPYSIQTRRERLTDVVRRAGGLTDEAYAEGFQLWRTEPVSPSDTLTAEQIAGRAVGGQDQRAEADTLPTFVGGREEADSASARADSMRRAPGEAPSDDDGGGGRRIQRTRVGIDFPQALENPDGREDLLVEPGDSIHVPHYKPTVAVRGAVGRETQVLWREGAGLDYYIAQAGGYAQQADEDRVRIQFANGEVDTKGGGFLFFEGGIADPDPGSTITVPAKPPPERGGGLTFGQLVPLITSVLGSITTIVVATN
jgi:protein involved in polysaccharide export with SLBB domain